jgi:hypothetical protein
MCCAIMSDGLIKMCHFVQTFVGWMETWARRILTNSIEQSTSWERNSRSASQEIPRLLWDPKVH